MFWKDHTIQPPSLIPCWIYYFFACVHSADRWVHEWKKIHQVFSWLCHDLAAWCFGLVCFYSLSNTLINRLWLRYSFAAIYFVADVVPPTMSTLLSLSTVRSLIECNVRCGSTRTYKQEYSYSCGNKAFICFVSYLIQSLLSAFFAGCLRIAWCQSVRQKPGWSCQ